MERCPIPRRLGALADAAAELAKQPDLQRAHDNAEKLRKMVGSNPKSLLKQLEKELPRTLQCSKSFPKFSRDAIDDSLKTLKRNS